MFHVKRRPGQTVILRTAGHPPVEVRLVSREDGGAVRIMVVGATDVLPGPGVRISNTIATLKAQQRLVIVLHDGTRVECILIHRYWNGRAQLAFDAPIRVQVIRGERDNELAPNALGA